MAPNASPTAFGSTLPLTNDVKLGYTRFPNNENPAQMNKCQPSYANPNVIHCRQNENRPSFIARFSPNSGTSTRTNAASAIMVLNPKTEISSPNRSGER